jgi:hypothetical protein
MSEIVRHLCRRRLRRLCSRRHRRCPLRRRRRGYCPLKQVRFEDGSEGLQLEGDLEVFAGQQGKSVQTFYFKLVKKDERLWLYGDPNFVSGFRDNHIGLAMCFCHCPNCFQFDLCSISCTTQN